MRKGAAIFVAGLILCGATMACGQVVISGRVRTPRVTGSTDLMPIGAMFVYASLDGSGSQSLGSRTWETDPGGWYRVSGSAGRYSMLFSNPGDGFRPAILTNVFTERGQQFDISPELTLDYAMFELKGWDTKAAHTYYQPFTARGKSITEVNFRLASDGVDGQGPGSQNMKLAIVEMGPGNPHEWKQVGPEVIVRDVDTGGVKNYAYGAGWNSGEVPTSPGRRYAVRLSAEKPDGRFQPFWDKAVSGKGCYREGGAPGSADGWTGNDMWLAVGGDSDGLLIPYNKRVLKQYDDLEKTGSAKKWTQTYVAQGRSLASVVMYAAWSGVQPGLFRQRAVVRVREGGPNGPVVGVQKIATGNGMHTGDASWGTCGAVYSPGEVPLKRGKTYALEFESIENIESLHDYVDIKNHPTNVTPSIHPYAKAAPDTYKRGRAYENGKPMDFDLDMQIVEYENDLPDWSQALIGPNRLTNGSMDRGTLSDDAPEIDAWTPYRVNPDTQLQAIADQWDNNNRLLRVRGGGTLRRVNGGPEGHKADGGFVNKVSGLAESQTYRVKGRVRCSWPLDDKHWLAVGYDSTGQTTDPDASTVEWTYLPPTHSVWTPYNSIPIRPAKDSVSVWLRGFDSESGGYPFTADFDDFELRQVRTSVEGAR